MSPKKCKGWNTGHVQNLIRESSLTAISQPLPPPLSVCDILKPEARNTDQDTKQALDIIQASSIPGYLLDLNTHVLSHQYVGLDGASGFTIIAKNDLSRHDQPSNVLNELRAEIHEQRKQETEVDCTANEQDAMEENEDSGQIYLQTTQMEFDYDSVKRLQIIPRSIQADSPESGFNGVEALEVMPACSTQIDGKDVPTTADGCRLDADTISSLEIPFGNPEPPSSEESVKRISKVNDEGSLVSSSSFDTQTTFTPAPYPRKRRQRKPSQLVASELPKSERVLRSARGSTEGQGQPKLMADTNAPANSKDSIRDSSTKSAPLASEPESFGNSTNSSDALMTLKSAQKKLPQRKRRKLL